MSIHPSALDWHVSTHCDYRIIGKDSCQKTTGLIKGQKWISFTIINKLAKVHFPNLPILLLSRISIHRKVPWTRTGKGQNMFMKTGKRFKLNIVPFQIKNIFPAPNVNTVHLAFAAFIKSLIMSCISYIFLKIYFKKICKKN